MGGITSVYVRAPEAEGQQNNESQESTELDLNTITCLQEDGEKNVAKNSCLEVKFTSTLPVQNREAEMGRIIQYLAEENVNLKRKLNQFETGSQKSSDYESIVIQPDLYDETDQQKIERLEKTLALERHDKWSAIERSEQYRVDLVNCNQNLKEMASIKDKAEEELSSYKRQIDDLQVIIERLKCVRRSSESERSTDSSIIEEIEIPRRTSQMNGEDITVFRAQLKEKREARQRAIAAKSLEINQMRDDLKKEKVMREKLERELHRLKKMRGETSSAGSCTDFQIEKENLLDEVSELKKELQVISSVREENTRLSDDIKKLSYEIRHLNTVILQQQNDLKEANRKHERVLRDMADAEKQCERNQEKQKEIEEAHKRMWEEYDHEKAEIAKRTLALKDVIDISRQMLMIREKQVLDLKSKLKDIEESLAEKQRLESSVLKVEYEKQLENIKTLKALYEERLKLMEAEQKKLTEKISDDAKAMDDVKSELSDLSIKYQMVGEELDTEKQENIGLTKELDNWIAQARSYERELSVMNKLLTQMLVGLHGADLDRLTEQLQENHALIAQMTTCEDCSDIASDLPKLLLDIIAKVEHKKDSCDLAIEENNKATEQSSETPTRIFDPMTDSTETISEQSEGLLTENAGAVLPIVSYKNATVFKPPKSPVPTEENKVTIEREKDDMYRYTGTAELDPSVRIIVSNLPKVWKVLTELLSHHSVPEDVPLGDERNCYKSIDTPNGPRSVISVSNTFIRLKDLILEKKSLQKEVSRLKHLNLHLESRLDYQEKRLLYVRNELHKTWGVVGRMRAQHQQLHNQEKILRYELQEKRVMLNELKQELEYCRDKWDKARRKNIESEVEWKKLRKEFAARKLADGKLSDSGESGFSDEQNDSDERSSTPSPVDFLNAAHVLEAVASQPLSSIDVVVTDQEVVIKYDKAHQVLSSEKEEESSSAVQENDFPTPAQVEGACSLEYSLYPESIAEPLEENGKTEHNAASSTSLDEGKDRAREEKERRLQRLEDECLLLVRKVDITTHKSNFLSNRLEELHEQYGSSDTQDVPPSISSSDNGGSSFNECPTESTPFSKILSENEETVIEEAPCLSVQTQSTCADQHNVTQDQKIKGSNSNDIEEEASLSKPTENCNLSIPTTENDDQVCSSSTTLTSEPLFNSEVTTTRGDLTDRFNITDPINENSINNLQQIVPSTENTLANSIPLTSNCPIDTLHSSPTISSITESNNIIESAEGQNSRSINSNNGNVVQQNDTVESVSTTSERDISLATFDERMAARAAKLKRLEEQCNSFFGKVSHTVQRGSDLSARLQEIHEGYANAEARQSSSSSDMAAAAMLEESSSTTVEQPQNNETEENLQGVERPSEIEKKDNPPK